MLSKKMQKALNEQINAEIFSSYLYLSMTAYFEQENWTGFAHWMEKQSAEEYGHAMKIFEFVNEVGGKVELEAIEKPISEWKSVLNVFEESLKHELMITDKINNLYNMASTEKDHASGIFLQWFVTEQVEEVNTVEQIIHKLKMIGEHKGALYMLDRELGSRA
ncbi:MAG: ferritin [Ignavibacteria bacterium]|nr:ferritin [Ignavibacteria bacterium]